MTRAWNAPMVSACSGLGACSAGLSGYLFELAPPHATRINAITDASAIVRVIRDRRLTEESFQLFEALAWTRRRHVRVAQHGPHHGLRPDAVARPAQLSGGSNLDVRSMPAA